MDAEQTAGAAPAFLGAEGEMPRLIAAHDWSGTLGPIETWPLSLKTTVGLMVHSPVPMVLLWGEDGIMIYNDAYSSLAGGRHPSLLGSKVREGWPEVADFNDHVMRVGMAGGTLAYRDQELTLNRTGTMQRAWMNLDYSPVMDESGRPGGVIALVVETTERVLSEMALRASEARLRFLDDLGRATARLSDADAILAQTTRMVGEYLGISISAYADMDEDEDGFTIRGDWSAPGSASIVGHYRLSDFGRLAVQTLRAGRPLIVNDNLAELRPEEAAAFRAIGIAATICMPLVKDGRLKALMAIHDKAPHTWSTHELAVITEVTDRSWAHVERVRAEAELRILAESLEQQVEERTLELRRSEEALRHAQKMEAVGQLTSGIAHDFNNLLAGISGGLELIDKRIRQGRLEAVPRYIEASQGAARRATALTQRLLAFSRRSTLAPRGVNVNRLVAEMEDLIRRTVGPALELQVVRADDLWLTLVDPSQLENALLNLCINARDAMPDGGRLTIQTANAHLAAEAARERDLPSGEYVTLSVTDTGTGMSPEVVERIFDPFYTTKPLGMGTGLGLSMVYGFVRQSGGQVRVHSRLGEGTTMRLYLPRRVGPEAEDRPVVLQEALQETGQGETVLVIDDEAPVRMLMTEVLQEAGYRVLAAADGPSGLKILDGDERIDLLVTDVGLPGGLNGRQVADAARSRREDLKVLFVTGYAETAVIGHGALDPGMQVITKPFAMTALSARVREMLAR